MGADPNDRGAHFASEHDLWRNWLRSRDVEARNALVVHYRVWLQRTVSGLFAQFRYALADFADYVNLGAMGLIGAIENYNPDLNVPFEAYAYYRVRGAVLNGLADYATEFQKSGAQSSAEAYLSQLEREDYDDDGLQMVVDAAVGLAFGKFLELAGGDNYDRLDPLTLYQGERDWLLLWQLVDRLPERERYVISEHYRKRREFKELAVELKVSAPRVCQLHFQALNRLRGLYEAL